MSRFAEKKRLDEIDEAREVRKLELDMKFRTNKLINKRFETLEDRVSFLENHVKVLERIVYARTIIKIPEPEELEIHNQRAICGANKTRGECGCQECNTN